RHDAKEERTRDPGSVLASWRLLFRTRRALGRRRWGGLAVLLLEALDAAGGVDELLLARVERVAVRADLDHERAAGRVGLGLVPARAGDDGGLVRGVNSLFRHGIWPR